ncbi:MAG: methionine--tRNA ligase, partial [Candidatus Kaiserbacteria bacterium]|nr:methionine--tRNA ligase [Candidatus Kaiserbacteria bacterium]
AGDIYKAAYEIKYCVGCELEKTDSELVDGCCPLHPNTEIEIREEENYYFRFSKYKDALLKHCAEQQDFVLPKERMNEITSFVTAGLKDFSISRRREKMSWGIPVPDDDEHVMYVWFDALVNYISAIGWPDDKEKFNKWWPATQLAGKDNLRQQTAMWQAMLLSAELPLSRQIFIHGFITSGGQKMSKTLRNVINPIDLIEKYGVDTVRYILLRHANPFEDSDLTIESIHNYYTDHLVNGLGNLVARVMKLAEEHLQGPVAMPPQDFQPDAQFVKKIEEFRFNEALDYIWEKIAVADNYMTTSSPYKKVKMDEEYWQQKGREDIFKLVGDVGIIAVHLQSVMPKTAKIILAAILANKKPENLFPRI